MFLVSSFVLSFSLFFCFACPGPLLSPHFPSPSSPTHGLQSCLALLLLPFPLLLLHDESIPKKATHTQTNNDEEQPHGPCAHDGNAQAKATHTPLPISLARRLRFFACSSSNQVATLTNPFLLCYQPQNRGQLYRHSCCRSAWGWCAWLAKDGKRGWPLARV